MTDEDSEFEALKAELQRHDVEPEELAVVSKDELEDLRDDNEEKTDRIDELEETKESLENDLEDLRDEVDTAKEAYAEALDEVSVIHDKEDLMEFPLSDLRERYEDLEDEGDVEGLTSSPAPRSGDVDPDGTSQSPEDNEREEELLEQKEFLERKSGALAETRLAQVEEELAELRGE